MAQDMDPELWLKMATEIAVAYLNRNSVERSEVPKLIREIREALEAPLGGAPTAQFAEQAPMETASAETRESARLAGERPSESLRLIRGTPRVQIGESIKDEYLISFEDGKHYRSLKRHLMAKYGMTPDDYRRKWGLPSDYPMVAPAYAKERSDVAIRIGLGRPAMKMKKARPSGKKVLR
jgi:predicted transcriptional regulator